VGIDEDVTIKIAFSKDTPIPKEANW